jgi:hypothetical protein
MDDGCLKRPEGRAPYPAAGVCLVRRALEEGAGLAFGGAEVWERFFEELWLNWWDCERVSARLLNMLGKEPPDSIWKTGTVRDLADWAESRVEEINREDTRGIEAREEAEYQRGLLEREYELEKNT